MSPQYFVTQCRHCPKKFEREGLKPGTEGQQLVEAVAKYVGKLSDHLRSKHGDFATGPLLAMQMMYGFECLKHFDIHDPAMVQSMDIVRKDLHDSTRKFYATDAQIQDVVAKLELDPEDSKKVLAAMKELRNALTENAAPPAVMEPVGTLIPV